MTSLVLFVLALLAKRFGELERFFELSQNAEPAWLLVGLVLQFVTYVAVAAGWKAVLRRGGVRVPMRKLVPLALSKLFADQALPGAGIGGHILVADRLTVLCARRSAAVAAVLVSMVGYYAAYAGLAVVMLMVLWLNRHATQLLTGLVSTLLLVALAVPSLALWLRRSGSRPLPSWLEQLGPIRRILAIIGEAPAGLVRDRRLLGVVTLANGVVFLADAATLAACMLAIGLPFRPATAFLALMAGSMAATLAPFPLGLGTFEASSTAMLGMLGVPFEAALTATLLLRGLTLWLPLVPSMAILRSTMRRPAQEDA